jgi:hypothetical protein
MWLLSSFFIVAGLTEGLEILDPLPTTLRNSNFVVELESSYIIARGATKISPFEDGVLLLSTKVHPFPLSLEECDQSDVAQTLHRLAAVGDS